MTGNAVELANVTKRYNGGEPAVDCLDLGVVSGEFLTLLGPSGCGKTTTLNLIAGLEVADEGNIRIDGVEAARLPPNKRSVGVVFQDYALFPHMSVEKNVGFPLSVRHVNKATIRERVAEMLSTVRLEEYAARRIHELSGGQRQRVAVARALIVEPAVLLMDEPLSALDKALRSRMQIELAALHRKLRTTTVYVTHDQEEALRLSDRVAVMRGGKIVQLDTPGGIYQRPNCPFVAGFVGEANFLQGKVTRSVDRTIEVAVDGGGSVVCAGVIDPGVSDSVTVAVRPEDVRLTVYDPQSGGKPDEDGLLGRARFTFFEGDRTVVEVELNSGTVLRALRRTSDPELPAGTSVRVNFEPPNTHVYAGKFDQFDSDGMV